MRANEKVELKTKDGLRTFELQCITVTAAMDTLSEVAEIISPEVLKGMVDIYSGDRPQSEIAGLFLQMARSLDGKKMERLFELLLKGNAWIYSDDGRRRDELKVTELDNLFRGEIWSGFKLIYAGCTLNFASFRDGLAELKLETPGEASPVKPA